MMATLTMSPTLRQPFATLDAPRMRSLLKSKMNVKNQQNGALMPSKRQPLSEVDSENIDPTLNMSTKRKRGADEDDHAPSKGTFKPFKASHFTLTTVPSSISPSVPTSPLKTIPSTPKSTPVLKPVGRSPQAKSCKPFARRSTITKSRPDSVAKNGVSRPFSIAAALSNGKAKKQSSSKAPASWSFEIHVDSEQEEMTNLMQHSTCVLDISDDEGKVEAEGRGKENIPPAELGINLVRSRQQESAAAAARNSEMLEEPRSPLGELNAADYYGEDCHAFSYAVVYDDEADDTENKTPLPTLPRASSHPPRSKLSSVSSISSISSILEATAPIQPVDKSTKSEPSEAEIEIWESGSAAGEESSISLAEQ